MDNTTSDGGDPSGTDRPNWTPLDDDLAELNERLNMLECQNGQMYSMLEEEKAKCSRNFELLRNLMPFYRTGTGEIMFPGKTEMKCKLAVMKREIAKLGATLSRFEKNRIIFESDSFFHQNGDNGCDDADAARSTVEQLDKRYDDMKREFDEQLLEIAKYRTILDPLRNELDANEKTLEQTGRMVNELAVRLQHFQSSTNQSVDWERELRDAKERLDNAKSVVSSQADQLKEKKDSYANALRDKEYQKYRADRLSREMARLTAEFNVEFDRMNKYYEKRAKDVARLPVALRAVQSQLNVQKDMKNSVENAAETLNRKLRMIVNNNNGDTGNASKKLDTLTARNAELRAELERMTGVHAEIRLRCEETQANACVQKSRLAEINAETTAKIDDTRGACTALAEHYSRAIDSLQSRISKIKAYCCHEQGTRQFLSTVTQETASALNGIIKDARRVIANMSNAPSA